MEEHKNKIRMPTPQYQYARERYQRAVAYRPLPNANQVIPGTIPWYLHPRNKKEKLLKGVRMSTKNAKKREIYVHKKNGHEKQTRPWRRLFPERAWLLFAGAIGLIIRIILYGPFNNKRSWPQPYSVRFGVPKPPVFFICQCFWYHTSFLIFTSPENQAKYLTSRSFVMLGQYYSEDRVFSGVLHLVFAWITPQSCMRYAYCTYTRPYTYTAYVSQFVRTC